MPFNSAGGYVTKIAYDKANEAIDKSTAAENKAASADTKSVEAVNTATEAKLKADSTKEQLNNIIIESGTSDAEVIQARGEYAVLDERLESMTIRQQPTEPVGVPEGTFWLDESDNTFQGTVFQELDEKVKTHDEQLAQKASKEYVNNEINKKVSGAPKGVFSTVSELQDAYPLGSTDNMLVTEDGKWYYWDGLNWVAGSIYQSVGLADGGVEPKNLSDYRLLKNANVFYSPLEMGSIRSSDGILLPSETSIRSKDYDEVEENTDYVFFNKIISGMDGTIHLALYDENKSFIQRITGVSGLGFVTFNSGANVKYVKAQMTAIVGYTVDNLKFQLSKGDTPTDYVEPESNSYQLNNLKIPYLEAEFERQQEEINFIKNEQSLPEKHTTAHGINMFYSPLEVGSLTSTTGVPLASATAIRSSMFDEVEPDTNYVLFYQRIIGNKGTIYVVTYDENYNFIERINSPSSNFVAFNTGSNVKYIKSLLTGITGYTVENLKWQLSKGIEPIEYVEPDLNSYQLPSLKVPYLQDQISNVSTGLGGRLSELEDTFERINVFSDGFKYIAYSGYTRLAPANTAEAVNSAKILGFNCVKADIRITADDVIVMSHDATVDDMTNGSGVIREMTLEQIKSLKVTKLDVCFDYDVRVSTLDEFLAACKKNSVVPFINLRDEYMDTIVPIIIESLKYHNLYDLAVFQSFYQDSLITVRENGFKGLCMLILFSGVPLKTNHINIVKSIGNCGVICFDNIDSMTTELVKQFHEENIPLEYAIVYDKEIARRAIEMGFDGIMTDSVYDENRPAIKNRLYLKTSDYGATWGQPTLNPDLLNLTSTSTTNITDNTIDVYVNEIQTNLLYLLPCEITFNIVGNYNIQSNCWYDKSAKLIKIKLYENNNEISLGSMVNAEYTGVLNVVF